MARGRPKGSKNKDRYNKPVSLTVSTPRKLKPDGRSGAHFLANTEAEQCIAINKSGERCSRKKSNGEYCSLPAHRALGYGDSTNTKPKSQLVKEGGKGTYHGSYTNIGNMCRSGLYSNLIAAAKTVENMPLRSVKHIKEFEKLKDMTVKGMDAFEFLDSAQKWLEKVISKMNKIAKFVHEIAKPDNAEGEEGVDAGTEDTGEGDDGEE